jgi:4-deoxy-L-threo-5-hexosulose-uronate ketol-isomerase
MEVHPSVYPRTVPALAPDDLRTEFLVAGLFQKGEARLRYWETDRTILGGICPSEAPIPLPNPPELKSAFLLERREAGLVNLAGPCLVRVDGAEYRLGNLDALYLGRGSSEVTFRSLSPSEPARLWLLSYPAHAKHASRHVVFLGARGEQLGGRENANERTLYKLIHPGAFATCQVVMGVTRLAQGSIWNTMPPHTHMLRSEVYLYFNIRPGGAVFHFMGKPQETRHLVVHDCEAVLSPPWSIHSGAGTSNYDFVWGMGGENQEFSDMLRAEPEQMR